VQRITRVGKKLKNQPVSKNNTGRDALWAILMVINIYQTEQTILHEESNV